MLNTTTYRQSFLGNNSANSFPCSFKILQDTDIVAYYYKADTNIPPFLLTLGTDYSVVGAGADSGFTVNYPLSTSSYSTLKNGEYIKVYRQRPLTQLIDLTTSGAYDPASVEDALDSIVMQLQKYDTAPRSSELDETTVDIVSRRLINALDPENDLDVVNLQTLARQIAAVADQDISAIMSKWQGTTDGIVSYVSVAGANVSQVTEFLVMLNGVPMEPTQDFTYDNTLKRITFTAGVPAGGQHWWAVATGYARTMAEYPAHNHDERYYTEDETAQLIGTYTQSGYANVPTVSDTYTLSISGGRTPGSALQDDELIIWKPQTANVETSVFALVGGLASKSVKNIDGSDPYKGQILTASPFMILQWSQASNYLKIVYPVKISRQLLANFGAWSKRQVAVYGPVDTSGLPNLAGSTGATTVTTSNISSSAPLVVNSANGADANGTADQIGFSVANLAWTGLSTNGTMYLYVDVAANGALTPGSTTLAPIYQQGGTPAVTNGQATFNIGQMQMFVGNGSTAPQKNRVFVGEVTVAANVVSAITWYAYNGISSPAFTSTLPAANTPVVSNHNIGVLEGLRSCVELKCLSTELGYSVGDVLEAIAGGTSNAPITVRKTYKSSTIQTGNSNAFIVQNQSTGGISSMTAAKWSYRLTAKREW